MKRKKKTEKEERVEWCIYRESGEVINEEEIGWCLRSVREREKERETYNSYTS